VTKEGAKDLYLKPSMLHSDLGEDRAPRGGARRW
jgi:hypothetical protein